MRASGIANAFDRDDLFSCDAPDGLGAAFFRSAVDQHNAAATLLKPTAETRPFKSERVSQYVEKRGFLIVERYADSAAVDRTLEFFGHACSSETELLAQNAFIEIVTRVEQHIERDTVVHGNVHAVHGADLIMIGDRCN